MTDLAHRGAVPPTPTRQAAQRLLAELAKYPQTSTRDRSGWFLADVRLVAEAVMTEAHPAKDAGMCASDETIEEIRDELYAIGNNADDLILDAETKRLFINVHLRTAHAALDALDDPARRGAALQAEVVRLRQALEAIAGAINPPADGSDWDGLGRMEMARLARAALKEDA